MDSSGADIGFFQAPPILTNQFHDDVSYRRCFQLFLSSHVQDRTKHEVASLGEQVISDKVFAWVSDAEHNKPRLRGSGRDSFGRFKGELVTGEGWRKLQEFGLAKGMVATGYDTPFGVFARPLQFLRLHLWEPSCANVTCPSAMQDGAARLLQLHLCDPNAASRLSTTQRRVFQKYFSRLTSRNPDYAWTSGQWMTERTGGSDVSLTETTATLKPDQGADLASKEDNLPLGPWSISGFKWFSSATDSNMTVLLARAAPGAGLSAFLAPMRRHDPSAATSTGQADPDGTRLNGVKIQRLKNKLGTQPLPTAELVLEDMRGWLIGNEGKGIQEISTVLTLTRVHSAVAAVGYAGRSLAIARAYSRVREIGAGKGARVSLTKSPLHMRTLAKLHAEYRGLMLLTFFTSYVLGLSEHLTETPADRTPALEALTPHARHVLPLLRVLTQFTKAYVCKATVALVFSCMECLGGVGYLNNEEQEYLNVARLYRDCSVLPIWEGTTDVLCTDFVRAAKHPKGGSGALEALETTIEQISNFGTTSTWDASGRWQRLRRRIEDTGQDELMRDARETVWEVADLLVCGLLKVDAARDQDESSRDILDRFLLDKYAIGEEGGKRSTTEEWLVRDGSIVFGSKELPKTLPRL